MNDFAPIPPSEPSPPEYGPPPVEYGPPPALHASPALTPGRAFVEIVCVFAALGVPLLVRSLIFGFEARPLSERFGAHLYELVVARGLVVIAAVAVVLYLDRRPWRSLGLHWDDLAGDIAGAVLALICIYGVVALVGIVVVHFWPQVLQKIEAHRVEVAGMFPKIPFVAIAGFTLFVGFYEELFFRGFLITRLAALVKSPALAVIVSSAVFGALHYSYQDLLAVFQISTVGIVLGILFLVRKSLVGPILVHFVFDFVSLTAAFHYIQKVPK